jgi:hypothetical protein
MSNQSEGGWDLPPDELEKRKGVAPEFAVVYADHYVAVAYVDGDDHFLCLYVNDIFFIKKRLVKKVAYRK